MFSVIIPVHNKLPHLDRSINSALNQSFKDFELILIDDASTDGSSEKLKEFQGENIRVFTRNTPGPGGYAARNLGIKEARGEWIAFLDADDEWYPDHLEKMNQLAIKFPEVYLMSCGYQLQNGNQKRENTFYKQQKKERDFQLDLIEYLNYSLSKQCPVWTSVAFVRKDSPVANELFPAKLGAERGGDLHAWLKLMCYHKQMAWSDHIGAIYYLDSVNMVTKSASTNTDLFTEKIYRDLTKNIQNKEEVLLKRYLNQRLKNMSNLTKNYTSKINLCKNLFWKGDFVNSSFLSFKILFFLPARKMISTLIK